MNSIHVLFLDDKYMNKVILNTLLLDTEWMDAVK